MGKTPQKCLTLIRKNGQVIVHGQLELGLGLESNYFPWTFTLTLTLTLTLIVHG